MVNCLKSRLGYGFSLHLFYPLSFSAGGGDGFPSLKTGFMKQVFEVQLSCLNALHHDVNHFEYKHSVKNIFSSTLSESVLVWVRDMNWFS